jgi:hypothetical protein
MRPGSARPILSVMKNATVVLALQLDEQDDCLAGSIGSDGRHIPFRGWIGLVAALDRLLDEADSTAPTPPLNGGPISDPKGDPR